MKAKPYHFPSGKRIRENKMSGAFHVCAIIAVFAVAALAIKLYAR